MSEVNRRFLLRERPSGRIDENTFELVEEAVPELAEGEALVRKRYISVGPTNRTWINDTPTYLPPVQIGEVMRACVLGEVISTNSTCPQEGQFFQRIAGWKPYVVAWSAASLMAMPAV